MKITIAERSGVCRWCGCTDAIACVDGCSWANAKMTVCSNCVTLDRNIRNEHGRRQIAQAWQETSRRRR